VYDSNVTIDHPIQYVLKPSDGTWIQEKFITLRTFSGDIGTLNEWDFSYDCRCAGRNQPINITRVELINEDNIRFYYQQQTSTILFVGQRINVYNAFGAIMFVGTIIPSPSKIEILESGKDWREGQVIVWPGSIRNTVIRVASVDSEGSIKRIEVVDYGFNHSNGEVYIASPYPVRPVIPQSSLTQTPSGLAFNYTLEIEDVIDGVIDSVQGYVAGIKYNPYFLENYQSSSYMGQFVFNNTTIVQLTPTGQSSISYTTWALSRTTLRYVFDTVASLRGRWVDESSHLSTDSMRLQDSFYYQQYSYVIESDVNPSIYKDLAAAVHLAGTKYFTKFNATSQFKLETSVTVTFPFITLNVSDVSLVADSHNVEFTKSSIPDDSVSATEISFKDFTKFSVPDDSVSATEISFKDFTKFGFDTTTSLDGITSKEFTKEQQDILITSELVVKDFSMVADVDTIDPLDEFFKGTSIDVADITITTDSLLRTRTKIFDDNAEATQSLNKTIAKYSTDEVLTQEVVSNRSTRLVTSTVIAFSPDTSSEETLEYFASDYIEYPSRYALVSVTTTIPE
jgi:hypothetical protein